MTPRQVMSFIRYHGVVLQAAKGLEPALSHLRRNNSWELVGASDGT